MTAFLRSVDTKTWKVVVTGWTSPTQNNAEGVDVVKREVERTVAEVELSLGNNKALNVILCAVDDEVFKFISSCTVAIKSWEILETTYKDDDSDEEEWSDANVSNFFAFTSKVSTEDTVNPIVINHPSNNISDDEEQLTEEELMTNYQMLFIKWSKLSQTYTTGEIEHRHGFSEEKYQKRIGSPTRKWVGAGIKTSQNLESKFTWKCYHCGKKGHIAPYYYKIYEKERSKYSQSKLQWVKKGSVREETKFDIKGDEGIFLSYSKNSRTLRVYNKLTQVMTESINVKVIDEDTSSKDEDQSDVPPIVIDNQADRLNNEPTFIPSVIGSGIEPTIRIQKDHPLTIS
ncbi:hypothetical protein LIER_02509 [Lithospermum erythrorhizon]|uniref:Retroviral polymerase SH3-like domain-containing protein n=1 Tax=Lithospermum erythrorhizon TaxID=34254 RepID=A0AAV3NPS0_LITER